MLNSVFHLQNITLFILFAWSMTVKGFALWRAAKDKQIYWFIAILILNTIGILELIYLFGFAKEKLTFKEIGSWFKSK